MRRSTSIPSEPLAAAHPIRSASGAVLSPHRAGLTKEALREIGTRVVDDLDAIVKGLPPRRLQVAEPELATRYVRTTASRLRRTSRLDRVLRQPPMTNAPPLGGLSSYQEAARAHGSVEEAVRFLRRLARIEHRTLLVLAAHLNAVPEWEVKCALSLHIWQDAEHCAWLRERVAELRKPPHYLDRPDDAALEAFFEELLRSRSTRELLTGVYHVLKPSVTAAIEEHVRQANPLAEQPTLRLLRFVLLEEREQLEWARHALEALGGVDAEWGQHLDAYLRAAGGVVRGDERSADVPPPRGDRAPGARPDAAPGPTLHATLELARAAPGVRRVPRRGALEDALRPADGDACAGAARAHALRVAGGAVRRAP